MFLAPYDDNHLSHPAERGQAWSVEAPLIRRCQHNEHLNKQKNTMRKPDKVLDDYLDRPQSPWSSSA